jgi:hypothetical protein
LRHGDDHTFTTPSPPPPASTPPPPSQSSPVPGSSAPSETSTNAATTATPAFAGVKLVSTRLTFGGKVIALKLSCPARTVGRCTGRTTVTARRGARADAGAGAGAGAVIILGRTRFSIAAGGQAKITIRVGRAGRRLLSRAPRLRGKTTSAAGNGAGQSKTTTAAVTIRRRHR